MQPWSTREDWCWLAAIFEGEGGAGTRLHKKISGNPRRGNLYAAISQTNREMLAEVQRIAGAGKIYSSPARAENRKPLWQWMIACRQARIFLNQLLPYIRSPHKREQVVLALAADIRARAEGRQIIKLTLAAGSKKRWEAARAKVS